MRRGTTVAARDVTRRLGLGSRSLDDVIDANAVVREFRDGATVVLQGLQHTDPALARLANNLALDVDHPVQVNAYLSPGGGARGLEHHYDLHDVFVVQLEGAKRWQVWDPLPRTTRPVRGSASPTAVDPGELGAPSLEVELEPGACLYLPRGHPHAAATGDGPSSHLTVGLLAIPWAQVARHAVDLAAGAGESSPLTASLPVRSLDPGVGADAAPDVTSLQRALDGADLRAWLAREVWKRQPATRLRPLAVPELDGGPLRFTPGPLLWLTEAGDRAVLGLGDRLLDLPGETLGVLAHLLAASEPIVPECIGVGDAGTRDVVVRRLLAEGVLEHA